MQDMGIVVSGGRNELPEELNDHVEFQRMISSKGSRLVGLGLTTILGISCMITLIRRSPPSRFSRVKEY